MSLPSLESADVEVPVVILVLALAVDAIVHKLACVAISIGPHHSPVAGHVTILEVSRVNGSGLLPHSCPLSVRSEARSLAQVFRTFSEGKELLVTITWSSIHSS